MRSTIGFATVITLLILAGANASGSEGSLTLSPAVVTLRGEGGQSTTQTLTLLNGTSRDFSFDLVAEDVIVREGKRTFVAAGTITPSIAATAVFSPRSVTVAAGSKAVVNVTVTLPEGARHRAIIAVFRGKDRIQHGGVAATASIGTLLTFALTDDVALDAGALAVTPQTSSSNLAVKHSCENRGTEPLLARGMLAVIDEAGQIRGKASIAPHRLLPDEKADLGAEYPGELTPGRYRLLVTYDFEGRTVSRTAEIVVR